MTPINWYGRTMTADRFAVPDLRPNFLVLACGTGAAALISFLYLPWPVAIASTVLTALMVAGAEIDARTFLLPDVVTLGAIVAGLLAAPFLDSIDPWQSIGIAMSRAIGMAFLLAALRAVYAQLRGHEGLGLGDVKLAAAAGAWLPLETLPTCFALSTITALVWILFKWHGRAPDNLRLPFGAFFCPALWLVFFVNSLPR